MSRKKILLIIPELCMGGAQRSFSKLSIELALSHHVYVVVFNKQDHEVAYPYGGELLSLDVKAGKGYLGKLYSFLLRVVRLRKLKIRLAIDTSVSFLEGADYANLLSRSTDKVIVSIRGSKRYDETIVGKFHWLRNQILIPWLYRKADVIVTVNKGIAQELKSYYGLTKSRLVTISNFYDSMEIKSLSQEKKSVSLSQLYKSRVLVTSGRLAPEKGLNALLTVFHQLKNRLTDLKLVIVGDGPGLNALISLCQKLNLTYAQKEEYEIEPDVFFAGEQSNVFKYLKGATVYLMNSSSEGFPNGLAEAMICEVPVVATDCPYGPREILAPDFTYTESVRQPYLSQTGLLMPFIKSEEDSARWVDYLANVLEDKILLTQLGKSGKEYTAAFNKEKVISEWNLIL